MIQFTVPGEPVPKGRPRSRLVEKKYTGPRCEHCDHPLEDVEKFIHIYTPKATEAYENKVGQSYLSARGEIYESPVRIFVKIFKPRPKRLMRKKDASGPVPSMTSRSDADNYLKSIMDGLNGLAYEDDRHVSKAGIEMWYHEKDGSPRAEIWITEWKASDAGY